MVFNLKLIFSLFKNSAEVDDHQQRTPTDVRNTAEVVAKLFYKKSKGIFQYTDGLKMTRYQFSMKAAEILGKSSGHLIPSKNTKGIFPF